jgi:hypothetical protein
LLEAHLLECGVQLDVLGTRSLPQTVQRLVKAVDLPFFSGDGVAWWLLHIHLLLEVTVE